MAKIANQNNLMDVISAEVSDLSQIIKIIDASSADIVKNISKNWKSNYKTYKEVVNEVFGENGVLKYIQNIVNSIDDNFNITQIDSLVKSNILSKTIDDLYQIFSIFDKIKLHAGIKIKILILKKQLGYISELANSLDEVDVSLKTAIINRINPDGLVESLKNIATVLELIDGIHINLLLFAKISWIKFAVKHIKKMVNQITSFSNDTVNLLKSMIVFKLLQQTFVQIQTIIDGVNNIKINLLFLFKLQLIKFAIKRIYKLINALLEISNSPRNMINALMNLIMLNSVITVIKDILENISDMNSGFRTRRKLKVLKKILTRINPLFEEITQTGKGFKNYTAIIKRWGTLTIVFYLIKNVINIINHTKVSLFFILKLKLLLSTIKNINLVVTEINNIKLNNKNNEKLKTTISIFKNIRILFKIIAATIPWVMLIPVGLLAIISSLYLITKTLVILNIMFKGIRLRPLRTRLIKLNVIFNRLGRIFATIALIAPLAAIGALAMIPVTLAILSIMGLIKLISILSKYLLKGNIIFSLLKISLMLVVLTIIATQLTVLSVVALIVSASAVNILIFFGVLMVTIIAVLGIGLLAIAGSVIIGPALIGFGLLTLAITALTLMAVQLLIIQTIKLDREKIKANVDTILGTCKDIIASIFIPANTEETGESKGWFKSIIEFVGGPIVNILGALMSIPFLALSVAAIGLITIMAVQLRILQTLNLDREKILANVSTVIDTCKSVINVVLGNTDDTKDENAKGWFKSIIEFVGGPIVNIIDAIMVIPFLALSITAISLVTIIAGQLRLLQSINLDSETINTTINTVIGSAWSVIDAVINKPDDSNPSPSKNVGPFKKLLRFLTPGLSNIVDAISTIGFLMVTSVAIGILKKMADDLSTISKFEIKGDIVAKTNSIITSAQTIVDSVVTNSGNIFKRIKEVSENKGAEKLLKSLIDPLDAVVALAEKLDKIKDPTLLDKKTDSIDKLINSIDRLSKIDLSSSKDGLLKDSIKFVEKIDKVKLDNLTKATSMFEQMAKFSESINGNFEGLAESLNEKIAPLLEELKEQMNKIPDNVNNAARSINSTITTNAGGPSTNKADIIENVKTTNPSLTEEEVEKIAEDTFVKNIQKTNQSDLLLEEILEILKNGKITVKN